MTLTVSMKDVANAFQDGSVVVLCGTDEADRAIYFATDAGYAQDIAGVLRAADLNGFRRTVNVDIDEWQIVWVVQ